MRLGSTLVIATLVLALFPGGALRADGTAVHPPKRNPWIADGPYPMSHHNPAQTDVSTEHGPAITPMCPPPMTRSIGQGRRLLSSGYGIDQGTRIDHSGTVVKVVRVLQVVGAHRSPLSPP